MKIRKNVMYCFSTKEHYDNFMIHARQDGSVRARNPQEYVSGKMVFVYGDGEITYAMKASGKTGSEWEISFTKADMQIGQIYKTIDGEVHQWTKDDVANVKWHNEYNYPLCKNIIEVYPMEITPIWKRPENKYRVKTELTKEQAEKLGLELCEVIE